MQQTEEIARIAVRIMLQDDAENGKIYYARDYLYMNADDNNNGNENADDNVEQTRYNNNTGEGMTGHRDYDMTRPAERDQENNNNANRYEVSKESAERITEEIDEIDTAYVLTMDNNAYVAAGLDTNDTQFSKRIPFLYWTMVR